MLVFKPCKFHRRPDLEPATRFLIGCIALLNPSYGTITELSLTYSISRTFVYQLKAFLEQMGSGLFEADLKESRKDELCRSLKEILKLRLIGRCSIGAISELMKLNGTNYSSVGYISQCLKTIGMNLPSTIELGGASQIAVVFASDEVFAHSQPILITVDPVSSAILKIELAQSRSALTWQAHWEKLLENDCYALYVVSDEGRGLQAAQSTLFPHLTHQPDTYHGVAHHLGVWASRLENAAWKGIGEEYERERVIHSARKEEIIEKRMKAYYDAQDKAEQKIQLYEEFRFLYHCILENLAIFDAQGRVRDPKQAEENIRTAIDWLKSLGNKAIAKEAQRIEGLLPDLLNFIPRAQQLTNLIRHQFPAGVLEAFCVAWQASKNAIKAKHIKRKHFFKAKEKQWLDGICVWLDEEFTPMKTQIYQQLDTIVQSSSLVETINSIVRPYLNTSKNLVSQHLLNLIMFYHNHRRYLAGKRKGHTPMELLTGKIQDNDWLQLLMERIEPVFPALLA